MGSARNDAAGAAMLAGLELVVRAEPGPAGFFGTVVVTVAGLGEFSVFRSGQGGVEIARVNAAPLDADGYLLLVPGGDPLVSGRRELVERFLRRYFEKRSAVAVRAAR